MAINSFYSSIINFKSAVVGRISIDAQSKANKYNDRKTQ